MISVFCFSLYSRIHEKFIERIAQRRFQIMSSSLGYSNRFGMHSTEFESTVSIPRDCSAVFELISSASDNSSISLLRDVKANVSKISYRD